MIIDRFIRATFNEQRNSSYNTETQFSEINTLVFRWCVLQFMIIGI